jgi:hypothetical protein
MCDPRELVVYFHVAGAAKTFIFCLMQLRMMFWVHVSVNPRCPAVQADQNALKKASAASSRPGSKSSAPVAHKSGDGQVPKAPKPVSEVGPSLHLLSSHFAIGLSARSVIP